MKEWKEVFGTELDKPKELDNTSSPTTIYQRRNIREATRTINDGMKIKGWLREERELTLQEYSTFIIVNEAVNIQKEQIIDDYTLQLINEGVI